jgi:hypothetical protein
MDVSVSGFWIDGFRYLNIDRCLIARRGITLLMLILACIFHQRFKYILHVCIYCKLQRLFVEPEILHSVITYHLVSRVSWRLSCYCAVGALVIHDLASWP